VRLDADDQVSAGSEGIDGCHTQGRRAIDQDVVIASLNSAKLFVQPTIAIDGASQLEIESGEIERGRNNIEIGPDVENNGP
jgi:hypothetical protein